MIAHFLLGGQLLEATFVDEINKQFKISDQANSISAFTMGNMEISFDLEALGALTHDFYEHYQLGFSYFINCILIKRDTLVNKNVAILDIMIDMGNRVKKVKL